MFSGVCLTELLRQYCSAVSKREEIERERDDHVKKIASPDVQQKEKDLEDKKRQLREIEKELGMLFEKGVDDFILILLNFN